MNYLNLSITDLTSAAFLGEEPVNRATWLCLMRYCAQQETGGIIKDAEGWGERRWQQLCGITKSEAHNPSALWSFSNGSLIVKFYPANQESAAKNRRNAIKQHNKQRGIECDNECDNQSPDKDKNKDKDKRKEIKAPPSNPSGTPTHAQMMKEFAEKHKEALGEYADLFLEWWQMARDMHGIHMNSVMANLRDWMTYGEAKRQALQNSIAGGKPRLYDPRIKFGEQPKPEPAKPIKRGGGYL
jgi:hypothetical protein